MLKCASRLLLLQFSHWNFPLKSKQGCGNIFTKWPSFSAKTQPVRERIKVPDWFAQISQYLRQFSDVFEKLFCDTYFLLFLRRFSAFVSRNTSRKTKRKFSKWQWGAAQTNTLFFVSFSKTSDFIPKSCRRKRVPHNPISEARWRTLVIRTPQHYQLRPQSFSNPTA